jgi:hypothetical protein
MGQIESINNAGGGTFVAGEGDSPTNRTPIQQQGANDQIRSMACSVNFSGDCKQFGNSMVATFGAECGGTPNCARGGADPVQGSFQQIPENYDQGIKAYLNACDQSNEACQSVSQLCVNGAGDRMTHICSTAAAIGKHVAVESSIVSAFPNDPVRQAAAHMLYQITPGQFDGGNVSNIQSFVLSDAARQALGYNGVSLPPGATGADAINALASKPGVLQGVALANGGAIGAPTFRVDPGFDQLYRPPQGPVGPGPTYQTQSGLYGGLGGNNQMMWMMLMGPLQQMMNSLQSRANTALTQQNPWPTQTTPPPRPPAATLSIGAQPNPVTRGASISLSWDSNATLINPPCQVTQNGTTISESNAGSRTIATGTSTPATLTFVFMCKQAVDGQTVQQSTIVNVQ